MTRADKLITEANSQATRLEQHIAGSSLLDLHQVSTITLSALAGLLRDLVKMQRNQRAGEKK